MPKPMDHERLATLRKSARNNNMSNGAWVRELLADRDHWEAEAKRMRARVHLIKPGTPAINVAMRCGLSAADATDADQLGSEDRIADIDCPGCLRDLIIDMRLADLGSDTPENRWLACGDTGTSSITIWSVMMGCSMPARRRPDIPHDPMDFGRCHRLLELFPAWRERLPEVSAKHENWTGLVEIWDELTDLYLEELPSGRAPRLWARMREVREVPRG